MTKITREMHDACLDAIRAIKAADPAHAERAMRRDGQPKVDAEMQTFLDLMALNAVASCWAARMAPGRSDMARAKAILKSRQAA